MMKLVTRVIRNHSDPKTLESISAKPFFKHYKSAISLSLQNRLEQSNEELKKSLEEIKASKENQMQHFSFILRRMAHNYRRLGQMKMAEQKIYDIIQHKRSCKVLPAVLYDDYDLLFRHLITYDIEKAAKLCKAILLKEKDQMPFSHIKLFHFNLGTAYLLAGNYVDAKAKFSHCLESDPQGKLKVYALNNLGVACWWHKNPIEAKREPVGQEAITVEKDFKQAKEIFGRAVMLSELGPSTSELQKIMLEQSLNFRSGKLNEQLDFQEQSSIMPIYNISRFYISNDPLQKLQILYWMKKCLNLSKLTKNELLFDRIFCEYCLLTHNINPLLQKLPNLIDKYRYCQHFSQEQYFCSVLAKLLPKDKQESQEYSKRAELIRGILPEWTSKLKYISIDNLNLTN